MRATGTLNSASNARKAQLGSNAIAAPPGGPAPAHAREPRLKLVENPSLDPAEAAGLAAALDEIPYPAFVIRAEGGGAFHVTRIPSPGGASSHHLAVEIPGVSDPAPRVAAAAARWMFTPRQSEVMALLALGQANKVIARALGCAPSTVEIHVTALLLKSGCENRCELVSRFWSEPVSLGDPLVESADRRPGVPSATMGLDPGFGWPATLHDRGPASAGIGGVA
jgi:DNA-binding CsgD family transcriptional regulator